MPPVTRESIHWAYRLLLGREAENESVVADALGYGSLAQLRQAFLDSPEFRGMLESPQPQASRVPVDCPPQVIEWSTDGSTLSRLLDHVRKTWTKLGQEKPHWSVLSSDDFLPENIAATERAFFESGRSDLRSLLAVLARHGLSPDSFPRLFEFGCGLGRVTPFFAERFLEVTACDVSPSHMAVAQAVVRKAGRKNVSFELVNDVDFGMTRPFDLWFSRIVLQHNSPPIIAMILRQALALLAPGGLAVFQVPTYALGYSFSLSEYLANVGKDRGIEMHVLPQEVVFRLAREAGSFPLEVLDDGHAGPPHAWQSNTFVFQKQS
jgi:SAM-dependent methyltransferase